MLQYQISPSPGLKFLSLSLYLLVLYTLLVYTEEILMVGLLALLTILSMRADWLRWQSVEFRTPTGLTLYPDSGLIELQQLDRLERFRTFNLYLTRWFLIIRLHDRYQSRSFLLIADRFSSMTDYLSFRHQILKMNGDQYAA